MKAVYDLVTRAIKSRVDAFSDQRLNDGDDVWHAREVELRCAVAATANAFAVEFAASDPTFDVRAFATASGLYVSNGRDNYSDCYPGELTWERPHDDDGAFGAATGEAVKNFQALKKIPADGILGSATAAKRVGSSDHELQVALPEYNGWRSTYDYPGYINYEHPDGRYVVCAASDFNGAEKLDIQIHTADLSRSLDDGENEPWPRDGRTAEKLFARIRPYLDKYHPSTTTKES